MHESGLAQSIGANIAGEVEIIGLREVLKVDVQVGELPPLDLDAFRFVVEKGLNTYGLPLDISRVIASKDTCTVRSDKFQK